MSVTITKSKEQEKLEEILSQPYILILHNDTNTFDHVISCLMRICKNCYESATQIAYLVHYKGKCEVKRGSKEYISKKLIQLKNNGLTATMETVS
jgi:ATP-dependent Clp protease adaptor protein ClpS